VPHSWNRCHSLSSTLPITAAPSLERNHAKRSREEEEQPQPAAATPTPPGSGTQQHCPRHHHPSSAHHLPATCRATIKENRSLHLYAGEESSSKAPPDTENSPPIFFPAAVTPPGTEPVLSTTTSCHCLPSRQQHNWKQKEKGKQRRTELKRNVEKKKEERLNTALQRPTTISAILRSETTTSTSTTPL